MERQYRDKATEQFASGKRVPKFDSFSRQAYKALDKLTAARQVSDLRYPASNRFERLSGDRAGQYSIRINDKWRVCFNWSNDTQKAFNIEIVDYH